MTPPNRRVPEDPLLDHAASAFRRHFHRVPKLVARAPGRVNLIGEHTDYNDGYVLPVAIGLAVAVAAAPTTGDSTAVYSTLFDASATYPTASRTLSTKHPWSNYVLGVSAELRNRGVDIPAAEILVDSELPVGAGLSSSAALEVAVCLAFLRLAERTLPEVEIVRLCRSAENNFVGVQCGIMDQFICTAAQKDCALLLDCRTLEFRHVRMPAGVKVLIFDSGVKHELASSGYNRRRQECADALAALRKSGLAALSLRDLSSTDLSSASDNLPPVLVRRCRHVISENARVLKFVEALERGKTGDLGSLLYESHVSLRDDYEVSCPELDAIVEICSHIPGVYGARMTGGGFGGSAVVLTEQSTAESVVRTFEHAYRAETGCKARCYECTISEGASVHQV